MSTSREPDDRGAVVVLVAVGMLALMGVMALAIDGGNPHRARKMLGSNNHWEGIRFAPRGQIEFSGSDTSALDGSLIAYSVKLNGSGMNITYSGASGGGEPRVSLQQ